VQYATIDRADHAYTNRAAELNSIVRCWLNNVAPRANPRN
jgi:hypothetical protein